MAVGGLVGREAELTAVRSMLDAVRGGPAALILDGEAGIGKTTLCLAAAEQAREAGFAVLTATGAAAQTSLTWAGLAAVLAGIDETALAGLSPLHQQTLRAISTGRSGPPGDERLIATALSAALEQLSRQRPVLIVADDAQWLDESSRRAFGFVVRRLTGPVAVLACFRTGEPGAADRSWVQPPDPQALTRLTLGPMSVAELSAMLTARMGEPPSRSAMARVHSIADGNPFVAVELARRLQARDDLDSLPPTLTALVRDRIGALDPATAEVLATAAAAFEPTVEVIAAATGRTPADVIDILEPTEARGLLTFDGPRVRFSHPLIASGIATGADPAAWCRTHRRLADAVNDPEQRARHLALGTPHGDPDTLAALDVAAESAAVRGAFGTAAELTLLAVRLGGEDPMRRLRAGDYLFRSGALDEAEAVVAPIIEDLPAGFLRPVGLILLAAVRGYRDGIVSTMGLFERAVQESEGFLRAQALLPLTLAIGLGGDTAGAVTSADRALEEAEAAGVAQLRSQAQALWAHYSFIYGLGVDSGALRAALDGGESDPTLPVQLQPAAVHAMICAWTGRLDEARTSMDAVLRRCAERGNDINVLVCEAILTSIDVAMGRYDDAEATTAAALARAEQIGGLLPTITAQTALAEIASRRGRLAETRAAAALVVEKSMAAGLDYHARSPLTSLAFAEVSEGRYDEALKTLAPLLEIFDPEHDSEIASGGWIPDAVEALTATGRTDEAGPLVAALETNGVCLDRPWMLATGARCRALVLAAEGDLVAAVRSAEEALAHHDRLPMPFERARTQLLIGQLLRRRRRTAAARPHLEAAAAVFDRIDSPLWAARAHRELDRRPKGSPGARLTDAERQVAERAADGQSNKQIAASLFISDKTVEMHLSHVYRKLGIRSRVQLADGLRDGEAGD